MIGLDQLRKKFVDLLGATIPKNTIEVEIFEKIELTHLFDRGQMVEMQVQVTVLDKWLDLQGKVTPSLILSIVDEVTPPLQLIFSNRKATSFEMKISMINSDFKGNFLFLKLICTKPEFLITQTFITIRDCEKLIAVASHDKLYLKDDFKDLVYEQTQDEHYMSFKVKFNKLWLNHLGEISSGCLHSIIDTAAVVIILSFSRRATTSVNLKLSLTNPKITGDYLYIKSSCAKQDTGFCQVNFTIRDCEKLIGTGVHFKIIAPGNVPKL